MTEENANLENFSEEISTTDENPNNETSSFQQESAETENKPEVIEAAPTTEAGQSETTTSDLESAENAAESPSAEATSEKEYQVPRYDVLITSEKAGYRAPKVAIGTLVRMLALHGFADPVDEAVAENWVEIYFKPSVSSHEIFYKYDYNGPEVFLEAVMRFEDKKPFFAEYGNTKRPLYWALEFRGCVYQSPLGPFRKMLLEGLNIRVAVDVRPHKEPMPPHRIVPEEEKPIDKKKRERGSGLAGTDVMEV